mmetsp:Transcript_31953/g.58579  ORF Transcript_31953/g.58579 Transcript_31953/m.58579 type:complete len:644 (+) Transcript_31953:163-2094(+)
MPQRRPVPTINMKETTKFRVEPEEASFLSGREGGESIRRIAAASDTVISTNIGLDGRTIEALDIVGDALSRLRAEKYVDFVINQMDGIFKVEDNDLNNDCSIVEVPDTVVGFVTGKHGNFLRKLEKQWGVIMFFAEYDGMLKEPFADTQSAGQTETLLVFGPRRARRGVQLTCMSLVEDNIPGYYSDVTKRKGELYEGQWCKDSDSADWGTSTFQIKEGLVPYATGKLGSTLNKLMRASGAVVRYLGDTAFFSGTQDEQARARDYLSWLLQGLEGPVEVTNLDSRTDVTEVAVPANEVGFVTGNKRSTLIRMEDEWGVLMLFQGEHVNRKEASVHETVPLLIFAASERARKGAELDAMCSIEYKQKGYCSKHLANKTSDEEEFDVEYWLMTEVEVSFCLGTGGQTRRKIGTASGAILQFVGHVCCIGGTKTERKRCWDYLHFLMQQMKRDPSAFIDVRGREDVTEIELAGLMDNKAIGVVTGKSGSRLRSIEQETATLCLVAKDHTGVERLCIFSHVEETGSGDVGRKKAEQLFRNALEDAAEIQAGKASGKGHYDDGYSRGYGRSHDWNSRQGVWGSSRDYGRRDNGKGGRDGKGRRDHGYGRRDNGKGGRDGRSRYRNGPGRGRSRSPGSSSASRSRSRGR